MSLTARSVLGAVLVGSLLALAAGCSGDAKGGDGSERSANGEAGSSSDVGSAGSVSMTGTGGTTSGGTGGSAASGATYTGARACELFARATCNKAVECGVVLAQTGSALICVQCDALSLGIIEQRCQQDSPGEKDAAAVDRCVSSLTAQPCAEACVSPDANDCGVFGDLSSPSVGTLVCDPRCLQ